MVGTGNYNKFIPSLHSFKSCRYRRKNSGSWSQGHLNISRHQLTLFPHAPPNHNQKMGVGGRFGSRSVASECPFACRSRLSTWQPNVAQQNFNTRAHYYSSAAPPMPIAAKKTPLSTGYGLREPFSDRRHPTWECQIWTTTQHPQHPLHTSPTQHLKK